MYVFMCHRIARVLPVASSGVYARMAHTCDMDSVYMIQSGYRPQYGCVLTSLVFRFTTICLTNLLIFRNVCRKHYDTRNSIRTSICSSLKGFQYFVLR